MDKYGNEAKHIRFIDIKAAIYGKISFLFILSAITILFPLFRQQQHYTYYDYCNLQQVGDCWLIYTWKWLDMKNI